MICRRFDFAFFVGDARIEDEIGGLLDEPSDMTVCDFCGVACRFRGDCIDTEFVDFLRRLWRRNDAEAQGIEKCEPERIVFVHIEHARNADGTARCVFGRSRCVVERAIEFVSIEIGDFARF